MQFQKQNAQPTNVTCDCSWSLTWIDSEFWLWIAGKLVHSRRYTDSWCKWYFTIMLGQRPSLMAIMKVMGCDIKNSCHFELRHINLHTAMHVTHIDLIVAYFTLARYNIASTRTVGYVVENILEQEHRQKASNTEKLSNSCSILVCYRQALTLRSR
jgi:hypothetical protein